MVLAQPLWSIFSHLHLPMNEEVEECDIFSDVSDLSFISELNDSSVPMSKNFDLVNGSPLSVSDFSVVHYNLNLITTDGRLDEVERMCLYDDQSLPTDVIIAGIPEV